MKTIALFTVATALVLASPAWGRKLPPLDQTRLFSEIAKDCSEVDLKVWKHPTRAVLLKKEVEIVSVKLCNDRKYPIFYVRFKFDPRGQTADYFKPLYSEMKKANGSHPFSFVALSDNTVVNVSFRQNGYIDADFEMYEP